MKKLRVAVLMGGKSPEHEVSLVTGREVVRNLDKKKYEVLPVVISSDGDRWQLKPVAQILLHSPAGVEENDHKKSIKGGKALLPQGQKLPFGFGGSKPEIAFIAMHGPFGEDGRVQGMLELAGIAYTGAGVLASALGMDKTMFRKIMIAEGIAVPECFEITAKIKFPVVVKPSSQGSSVGVSIVRTKKDLAPALKKALKFGPQVMIEKYLSGLEVTCGVLGNENPMALPVVEIVPQNEFFDYEAKYNEGKCREIVPARISEKLTKQVQNLAIRVYKAIDCRGFGRVDMIISEGKPYVLEINTIPGLTPMSLFPKAAAAAGLSYPQLLDRLIELALEK